MNQLQEEKIWEVLDGNADNSTLKQHTKWLKTNADYRLTFEQCERLHKNLLALPLESPSLRFTQNIMDTIMPQLKTAPVTDRRPLIFLAVVAILSAILIALFPSSSAPIAATNGLDLSVNTEGVVSAMSSPMLFLTFILLNVILLLIILDRRVLRPYFEKRYAK